MLTKEYLAKGLTGMARALQIPYPEPRWVYAHYGAAPIAAYYFQVENDLDAEAARALRGQIDLLMATHPAFFEPFPPSKSNPTLLDEIPRALEPVIYNPFDAAHHVIYSMLAIKALKDVPDMLTPEIVGGIRDLIDGFRSSPEPTIHLAGNEPTPVYPDPQSMLEFTLREFVSYEEIYYGWQGKPGHLLTHAQALVELGKLGYADLARTGLGGHRLHAKYVHDEYEELRKNHGTMTPARASVNSPLTKEFWAGEIDGGDWLTGHIFKYPYTVHNLIRQVEDVQLRREAERQLSHLLTRAQKPVASAEFNPSSYRF